MRRIRVPRAGLTIAALAVACLVSSTARSQPSDAAWRETSRGAPAAPARPVGQRLDAPLARTLAGVAPAADAHDSPTELERLAAILAAPPPDQPISLIVRLDGPALLDVIDTGDGPVFEQASLPPIATLTAFEEALASRQRPVEQAIVATGAQLIDRYQVLLNGFLVHATTSQAEQIGRIPGVSSVARAPMAGLALTDSVPHIGAPRVWSELKYRGEGTLVAVLDTGIDYTHATFGGSGDPADYAGNDEDLVESGTFPTARVVGGYDFAGKRYSPIFTCGLLPGQDCHRDPRPDDDPLDSRGHGTFMAGVIAGTGTDSVGPGVAPGAGLVALKVFGNPVNSAVVTDLLASALDWVARNNLRLDVPGWPTERVDVVNLSLTGGWLNGSVEAERLVADATRSGLVVIAAAGNDGDIAYAVDTVAAAASSLSVADSYASGEGGLLMDATWSAGGASTGFDCLAVDSWITGEPRTSDLGGFAGDLAWMGSGCTDEPPVQDVTGKVALLERGTCPFTDKLLNAQAAGATAGAVFSDADHGVDHMYGSAQLGLPAVMIPRWAGWQLVELLTSGTAVSVRVRQPSTDIMVDTLGFFSARGPARLSGMLKPQLTAPGEVIRSAWFGSGTGGLLMSGTSIGAAHVSGVVALLAERSRKQHLALEALDLAALAMNYAVPTVKIERQDVGRLAPVARQGAGRVDAYHSAAGGTLVRTEEGIAGLSYGSIHVVDQPATLTRQLTVRNLTASDKQYRLSPELAYPEEDLGHGVEVSVQPSSLSVPAQQSAEATVTMNVTPAEMRPWALAEREPAIEPDLLSEMEVDGFLKIDELGGDGQPKADGDRISVPFLSLPRRHACVASTTNEDFALGGIEDRVPQSWSNPCPEPGMARLYSQVATDPVDDQLPGAVDITGVGFRYEAIEPPPGETEPDTRLEWIIQTRGSRPTPQGVQFRVYLDVNMDGEFDWVVFNQYGPDLTLYMEDVDYPRGRWVVAHAPVFPGTLEPDYGQTEGLIFFQPYDLDETTSRLYAVAQELDIDMSSGVARFSFAVSAADASGDYDEVDGAPAIDRVPDDLADGGQLTYEQGRQACLAPWVDVPVPAGGDATVDLTSRCNAPPVGDVVPLRLLVSLPYNLPGSGQVQTRYGELKPLEPGPSPTPVVTGIPIYLPYGVRP